MTYAWQGTSESDRPHRSRECKLGDCDQCHGYYDTSGTANSNDTYRCLCACHTDPSTTSTSPHQAQEQQK